MHLAGNASAMEFDPFQTQQVGAVTGPVTGSQYQYVNPHHLGEKVELANGQTWRYAVANSTNALVAGTLNNSAAEKNNHYEINPTTAVSSTAYPTTNQVTLTLGATAAVAGEYNEGWANWSSGSNQGISYQISYNPVALASATTFTITLYDYFQNAVATSDTVDLVHSQWINIVESTGNAAAQTTRAAGVSFLAATAGYGCWVATHGLAPCLADGTVAVGTELSASSSTAGAVTGKSTTWSTAVAQINVGYCGFESAITTNSKPVFLLID